jgi:hypothetical protein
VFVVVARLPSQEIYPQKESRLKAAFSTASRLLNYFEAAGSAGAATAAASLAAAGAAGAASAAGATGAAGVAAGASVTAGAAGAAGVSVTTGASAFLPQAARATTRAAANRSDDFMFILIPKK